MKLFGLTGGVGMGKSTAGELLKQFGLPVVDTDTIARQLVEPGQPALLEIQKQLGAGIVDCYGRLRRDELAKLVFSDAQARQNLEAILHPPIRRAWQAEALQWREKGHLAGVVIIPLLFETDAAAFFNATICLACSAASQNQRLQARGWSNLQIKQRVDAQWPIEKKIQHSNFVVWTETTLEVHALQLKRVIDRIVGKPG